MSSPPDHPSPRRPARSGASRRRAARRGATLLVATGAAAASMASCYSATEIQLSIETDVPCAVVRDRGVAIFVAAKPGSLHDTGPVATTNECTEGPGGALVGTLTLVPSGGLDEQLAVEIVAGVDRPTEDCFPDPSGCIVARRAPRYIAHTSVRLPVRLSARCKNTRCGAAETCDDTTGSCVPVEGCAELGCAEAASGPTPAGGNDADAGCVGDCNACASPPCEVAVVMDNVAMPSAIAVAGDDVYVTSEVAGGSLVTCKTTGCTTPTSLVGAMNNPNAVAADDTNIYFSSSDTFLRKCGRPACTAPVAFGNDSFSSIKMSASTLYTVSEFNAYAGRILKADGVVAVLSTTNPLAIAIDANDAFMTVYTGSKGGLLRCPLSGCVPLSPAPRLVLDAIDLRGIAVDETDIYWTEAATGRVMKVQKDFLGRPVVISATARRPIDIMVHGAFVYWTEEGTTDDDGVINSYAKAGGAPLVLAQGQHRPYRLAIAGGRVYWTNRVMAGSVRATSVR